MKAKGVRFGRTGYRKKLTGKQTLKAEVKWSQTHTRLKQGGVCGGAHVGPLWLTREDSVALDLFHQAACGRSSECALKNVF